MKKLDSHSPHHFVLLSLQHIFTNRIHNKNLFSYFNTLGLFINLNIAKMNTNIPRYVLVRIGVLGIGRYLAKA